MCSCSPVAGQLGANEPKLNALMSLLEHIMYEPLFDALRTKQQLGYIASGSQVEARGVYSLKVADQFGVPLAVLLAFNGWATGSEFPFPGQDVKIPPGALPAGPVGETIPDSGSNCPAGQYTIEASDTARTKVAEKFDVTVDALDAANAGTSGYGAFYPGLKIVIPAKAGC